MKKILLAIVSIAFVFVVTGCSLIKNDDDKTALKSIKNAINKVYENKEVINTKNVQKYMEDSWVIVEAPADTSRTSIPKEINPETIELEWDVMFITVCNKETEECKDLRIFRDTDDNTL
jgi:hypothetical protein